MLSAVLDGEDLEMRHAVSGWTFANEFANPGIHDAVSGVVSTTGHNAIQLHYNRGVVGVFSSQGMKVTTQILADHVSLTLRMSGQEAGG